MQPPFIWLRHAGCILSLLEKLFAKRAPLVQFERFSANIKTKFVQHNYSQMTSNGLVLSTLYPTLYDEYHLPNIPFSMPKVANFLRFVLALFDLNSRRH